jgi:hypothetical protein
MPSDAAAESGILSQFRIFEAWMGRRDRGQDIVA